MLCKQVKNKCKRFNSPESCITFLARVLKSWFVNETWDTIFDILNKCQ